MSRPDPSPAIATFIRRLPPPHMLGDDDSQIQLNRIDQQRAACRAILVQVRSENPLIAIWCQRLLQGFAIHACCETMQPPVIGDLDPDARITARAQAKANLLAIEKQTRPCYRELHRFLHRRSMHPS